MSSIIHITDLKFLRVNILWYGEGDASTIIMKHVYKLPSFAMEMTVRNEVKDFMGKKYNMTYGLKEYKWVLKSQGKIGIPNHRTTGTVKSWLLFYKNTLPAGSWRSATDMQF